MEKLEVKVSATSANMGPGFDSVGIALNLYNVLQFERLSEGLIIEGSPEEFRNEQNLAFLAYKRVMEEIGENPLGVKINIETNIPVSRGLGSSAALIAAGAAAANAFCGYPLSERELITLSTEIEGHPDNLAPAFLGGLVASAVGKKLVAAVKYTPHPKYKFTVLIPDFKLSTERARRVLPKTVSMNDAVSSLSNTAVLLKCLEIGESQILSEVANDRLHQPYRKDLIPGWDSAAQAAEKCSSLAFFISGAGPTLLCISENENFSEEIKPLLKEKGLGGWAVKDLIPDMTPIKIKEL